MDVHDSVSGVVGETDKIPEKWVDRIPTVEENVAQVKISKCWRGHFVRRLIQARDPNSELSKKYDVNTKTFDALNKVSQALEPQSESAGLSLLKLVRLTSRTTSLTSRTTSLTSCTTSLTSCTFSSHANTDSSH